MGEEKEIDLNIVEDSEFSSISRNDEFSAPDDHDDNLNSALDERDFIPPIKDTGDRAAEPVRDDLSAEAGDQDGTEPRISPDENPAPRLDEKDDSEADILLANGEERDADDTPLKSVEEDLAEGSQEIPNDDPISVQDTRDGDNPAAANATLTQETDLQPDAGDAEQAAEALPGASQADLKAGLDKDLQTDPINESDTDLKLASDKEKIANKWSLMNKISSIAVLVLLGAGMVFYLNPALIGLSKTPQPVNLASSENIEIAPPVQKELPVPSPPGKRERFQAKLDEAISLRNQLLEKKNEINQLDLHYRNGIAELEADIQQEKKRAGITTYQAAIKNKRIELTLRSIQRRRAYIEELKKPAHWLNSGSEELYYLVRKAELDLQLTDIAGGIDLNKHLRHISAAIQKYHPRPDKLAIDPLKVELEPLKKIWKQVGQAKRNLTQNTVVPRDEIIANEICSGNYERVAELTTLTPNAATCLARMEGSHLILNSVTTLSADAAKRLVQWPGNWICLNSVKDLSEPAAQYLFKWKGSWLSLNSLKKFPAELAHYLLKWEGQQLELMGLDHSGDKAEQKSLKFLALWETTGGKLFVPEKIRQKMKSLM
jgi:hypothetical protein